MTTEIDICNKAINRLGGNTISSSDGSVSALNSAEPGIEEKLCKANYAIIRDVVLEDRIWSFALARAILDTPDATKPAFGYDQRFQKPSDMLFLWRLSYDDAPISRDADYTLANWRVEGDFILADNDLIRIEYIKTLDQPADVALFSNQFIDVFSLRLAAEICMAITENRVLMQNLMQEYQARLVDASSIDGAQAKRELFRADSLTRIR